MTTDPGNPPPRSVHLWRIFPAIAIVAIGVLFLLNNLGYPIDFLENRNWWAVFILIAAAAPLTRAYELQRARGRFDAEIAHYVLCAAGITLVAVLFLTNADWGVWWPLFVILGGLFTLARKPQAACGRRGRATGDWQHDDRDATFKR